MADYDGIWSRGGINVEELPDPFASTDEPPSLRPDREGEKPKKRSRWKRARPFVLGVAALFAITIVWLIFTAPLSRALQPLPDPAMVFVSSDGVPFVERGAIKEAPVDAMKLNPLTPAAFVAIEDRRFYHHWGIDPHAIGRALLADLHAGGVKQGGSTITQQLAKTNFLSSDRTLRRKAQEVIIAFWLEAWLSKQQILSRYLSSVYFGDGVYGLRAAAHHYFNRDPERLTLAQSAMLAGIVQAPSRLAPTHNLEAAQARSELVLRAMAETGVISAARAQATIPARPVIRSAGLPTGTYFADWVVPQAQKAFESEFGQVRVPTTLDSRLQRLAERAVTRAPIGDAQAALVAMRPDGRVVAMVGGKSYGKTPYNRVTQALRQPGSAFKLFVYLAAMRSGWTPNSMIEDKPITIGGWSPENHDHVFRGPITLREAFARSSNAATVRLSESVGRANVLRAARDLGISTPLPNEPSVALGTGGVSLLDLTSAYAAIASGRYPVIARGLPEEQPQQQGLSSFFISRGGALDPSRDRASMLDLLYAAANEGTGHRAALWLPTFGNTGTTQDTREAVFVGFAGDLVVGIWVGRDDNKSLGRVSGGTVPAEIWHDFMSSALAVDHTPGPDLPNHYSTQANGRPAAEHPSPLPAGWSNGTKMLRSLLSDLENLLAR